MALAESFAGLVAGCLSRRRTVALYTVVQSAMPSRYPVGAKLVCPDEGLPRAFGLGPADAEALMVQLPARDAMVRPSTRTCAPDARNPAREVRVFCECLRPPLHCVIVGAGHIARPLARIVDAAGWTLTVADDRADFAHGRFFPERADVICTPFGSVWERVPVDRGTAVVLITRGHRHDVACLRALVGQEPFYIGLIGSRRRIRATLDGLEAEGVPEAFRKRVYAPVGLPLDAQAPVEIALAIAAEITAVWCGRGSWARRQKEEYYRSA